MSEAAKIQRATITDLLAIPEEHRRHEIIDGVLVEKEAASGRHGGAQVQIAQWLRPYGRRPGGRWPGGWWFATEVEIQFDDTQVFRPDVAGWRRERMTALPSEVPDKADKQRVLLLQEECSMSSKHPDTERGDIASRTNLGGAISRRGAHELHDPVVSPGRPSCSSSP